MVGVTGYGSVASQYGTDVSKSKLEGKEKVKKQPKSSESKLSQKAASYLDELRKKYGDYDFVIADKGDDYKGLTKNSKKEYSVILTSEEIEKMANDENYASEKMKQVKTVVDMTKKICEQNGFVSAFDKDATQGSLLKSLSVSIGEDGSMNIFAELEKVSERQKELFDKMQDKKNDPYHKNDKSLSKKTTIEASSMEEFLEKIQNLDWNSIPEQERAAGERMDFNV